jgi:hypothetical protein
MTAMDASSARRTRPVRVVYLILVAAVTITGIVAYRSVKDTFECSPPSYDALKAQETFVLDRVTDARDVQSGTSDCDDDGDGHVDFTTDLTPAGARDAFLADQSCSPYTEDGDELAVSCTSEKSTVYVFFTSNDDGTTQGELNLS